MDKTLKRPSYAILNFGNENWRPIVFVCWFLTQSILCILLSSSSPCFHVCVHHNEHSSQSTVHIQTFIFPAAMWRGIHGIHYPAMFRLYHSSQLGSIPHTKPAACKWDNKIKQSDLIVNFPRWPPPPPGRSQPSVHGLWLCRILDGMCANWDGKWGKLKAHCSHYHHVSKTSTCSILLLCIFANTRL